MSEARSLQALFLPNSIAVVGASPDLSKVVSGSTVLKYLLEYGFPGDLYPVNPRYQEVLGLPCYPSISAVPGPVDLAVIALPAPLVPGVLEECGQHGVRAAIVVSSGFGEHGEEGRARERALLEIADSHGIALVGPNCEGVVHFRRGLAATFATALASGWLEAGNLSIVTQSGALGVYMMSVARQWGIGLNYYVSTGNAAQLHVPDFAEYLVGDPDTRVLGVYLEGIADGRRLLSVADAYLQAGKPIVLLKGGMTDRGGRAAMTHTGTLAGDRHVWEGVARQCGMVLARSLEDFLETAATFSVLSGPVGPRVAVATSSGGAGVLVSDAADELGVEMAEYTPETVARLKSTTPFGDHENPLDLAGVLSVPGLLERVLRIVVSDPRVDALLVVTGSRELHADWLSSEIIAVARDPGKPVFVCWVGCPAEVARKLWRAGVPTYSDPVRALRGASRAITYWQRRAALLGEEGSPPDREGSAKASPPGQQEPGSAKASPPGRGGSAKASPPGRGGSAKASPPGHEESRGLRMLGEWPSKELLARYGIAVPRGLVARSAEEALEHAAALGYPVAIKVESPDIVHKSDVGGVALDLRGPEELRGAYEAMVATVSRRAPRARLEGVYVQQMGPSGIELLMGVSRDPQFGPVLLVGLGGIWAEALEDVAVRTLPVSRQEVRDMLASLKGSRILRGWRGVSVSLDAVEEAALALSRLAADLGDRLHSLDINPLLAHPSGAVALDARIAISH